MNVGTLAALYAELEKLGAEESLKDRAMTGFVKARPYIAGAAKTGLPAALAGRMLFDTAAKGSASRAAHAGRTFGLIGAGAGVANVALQRWAQKHKRNKAAKEILKESAALMRAQEPMRKVAMAASAADLRRTGIGGVKRPAFATEGSKGFAEKQLTNAKKPGKFFGMAKPRNLQAPGPSIKQVSPLPGG